MIHLHDFEPASVGSLIADPPWAYDSPKAMFGKGNVQVDVGNHYQTLNVDQICELPVRRLIARDAVLLLWVTNPMLAEGLATRVAEAWGFKPKTIITWAKVQQDGITPSRKTGHWFRSASEHVLFATRGSPKRPPGFPALASWFAHARLPHSVKPDTIHQYAEAMGVPGSRLEMFARRTRPGWYCWGDDPSLSVLEGDAPPLEDIFK